MKLHEAIQLTESLSSHIEDLGEFNLPIRLSGYINSNYDNFDSFLSDVARYETRNPSEARNLLHQAEGNSVRLNRLVTALTAEEIPSIPTTQFNRVMNNGDGLIDSPCGVIDDNGDEPRFLFRYISRGELESIERTGSIAPSNFYGRIHASYEPDRRYIMGDGELIAIKYDKRDGWRVKVGSDEIYAVTDNKIDISKVMVIK